jgi:hypothetical protein
MLPLDIFHGNTKHVAHLILHLVGTVIFLVFKKIRFDCRKRGTNMTKKYSYIRKNGKIDLTNVMKGTVRAKAVKSGIFK